MSFTINIDNTSRVWFSVSESPYSTAKIEKTLNRMYTYATNKELSSLFIAKPEFTYIVVCGYELLELSYNEWNVWGRLLRGSNATYHGKVILKQTGESAPCRAPGPVLIEQGFR